MVGGAEDALEGQGQAQGSEDTKLLRDAVLSVDALEDRDIVGDCAESFALFTIKYAVLFTYTFYIRFYIFLGTKKPLHNYWK